MDAITHTVNMPLPAGYEDAFRTLGEGATAPKPVQPVAAASGASDMVTAAMTIATTVKRVDYVPIGVADVATILMLGLVWRHLRSARERMRAIAAGEGAPRASWLPDDDHAERIAFETRYGRGSLR